MKKIILKEIRFGTSCRIFAYGTKNDCPVMDFFIKQKRERPDELAKLLALLETTANHGTPKNKQKCRLLEDKIYEFKTTGGLRLLFFLDKGQLIVATHGYIKQKQKMPPGELKRAKRIREEYLEAKEQDRIETERSD